MNGDLKPVLGSQIQMGHPLAKGLVGCWLKNEGSGNIIQDLSGNGNKGSFVIYPIWSSGKFGHSLLYNGTSPQGSCIGVPSIDFGYYFTMIFWVYSQEKASINTLYANRIPGGASTNGFSIEINNYNTSDRRLVFENTNGASQGVSYSIANAVLINKWVQCVLVVDRILGKVVFYVNGINVTEVGNSIVSNFKVKDTGRIGSFTNNSGYEEFTYKGFMDNVAFWNRALSANEIAKLYLDPFCMFEEEV
jgi:hypothetical protein